MQGKIFVVIPVYNRVLHTLACLRCLAGQTDANFRVILVNDGSTDDTKAAVLQQFPWVTILDTVTERWWTGSTNDGITYVMHEACPGDYILLLNNDLELHPDFITTFRASATKHGRRTLIGAVVLSKQDQKTIIDGGAIKHWRKRRKEGPISIQLFASDHVETNVGSLTGRGVLYPIEVFAQFGLFDDIHFKQCGDTEFPIRLKRKGYSLVVDYGCRVYMNCEDSFTANVATSVSLCMWHHYFFDVRSNCNLKYTYYLCRAMSGTSFFFIPHLIYAYCLTIGGFLKAVILTAFGGRVPR